MDLVQLQQSAKRIRNPFGFDFTAAWDRQKIVLKGDGKWKTVIGRLRDHIANRLYDKIYNQYHDEQVSKLKAAGRDKDARKFVVSAMVENKIWFMITGEEKNKGVGIEEEETANLTELKDEISTMERTAKGNGGTTMSISEILDNANGEALSGFNDSNVSTKTQGGTAQVNKEVKHEDPITKALNGKKDAPKAPAAEVKKEVAVEDVKSEFGDLNELT